MAGGGRIPRFQVWHPPHWRWAAGEKASDVPKPSRKAQRGRLPRGWLLSVGSGACTPSACDGGTRLKGFLLTTEKKQVGFQRRRKTLLAFRASPVPQQQFLLLRGLLGPWAFISLSMELKLTSPSFPPFI